MLGPEGKSSRTAQFIHDSKQTYFDKDLFKRDVSPVKLKTLTQNDITGKFNLNNYMQDLERKYNTNSNGE